MRQSRPYIACGNLTIVRCSPSISTRQTRNADREHLADLGGRACCGMMYRSLLKLPAKKVGLPPRTTFAAICRMVVDETLRLPRPFLGGQIMTGRDRPDIAPTATVAPQRARFFGKGSQNPAIVASSNRNITRDAGRMPKPTIV